MDITVTARELAEMLVKKVTTATTGRYNVVIGDLELLQTGALDLDKPLLKMEIKSLTRLPSPPEGR